MDATLPGALMTAEDMYAIPDDGSRYELVGGVLRVSEPPGGEHCYIASRLIIRLGAYVDAERLGIVMGECGYVLRRQPDTVRGPDVSFIRRDRIPRGDAFARFIEGAPDLVVEVVSPGDRRGEIAEKVEGYLDAGAQLVWVVYPRRTQVVVHDPEGIPEVLGLDGALEGRDVVSGFSLPLAELFAVPDD